MKKKQTKNNRFTSSRFKVTQREGIDQREKAPDDRDLPDRCARKDSPVCIFPEHDAPVFFSDSDGVTLAVLHHDALEDGLPADAAVML